MLVSAATSHSGRLSTFFVRRSTVSTRRVLGLSLWWFRLLCSGAFLLGASPLPLMVKGLNALCNSALEPLGEVARVEFARVKRQLQQEQSEQAALKSELQRLYSTKQAQFDIVVLAISNGMLLLHPIRFSFCAYLFFLQLRKLGSRCSSYAILRQRRAFASSSILIIRSQFPTVICFAVPCVCSCPY